MARSHPPHVSMKGLAKDPALASYKPAFKYLWRIHLQGCTRRGIVSEITPPEFHALITSECRYCGSPPKNMTKLRTMANMPYNGVDRIDNSKPYSVTNSATCCKLCNSMKSKLSVEEFLAHIRRIFKFHDHP